jgi:hypothetical protein
MRTLLLHKLCLVPLLALGALGCEEPLEPSAKVDSFRVLAEQADLPYARPGEDVQLSSLSYDPEERAITWAWASCLNPSSSDLQGCLASIAESGDPAAAVFAMGEDQATATLTIPSDALSSLPAAIRPNASVGVVSVACPGDLSFDTGPGGLPFRCQEPATGRDLELDEFIVGLKRITVRETDRNQNPIITGITFDGVDWPEGEVREVGSCSTSKLDYSLCSDTNKHQLAAQLSPESFERGTDEHGTAFEEQLVIQHYATEGIFENEVRIGKEPKNGWVARSRASGQLLTLWFVARDNRGGVTWAQRQVQVQ